MVVRQKNNVASMSTSMSTPAVFKMIKHMHLIKLSSEKTAVRGWVFFLDEELTQTSSL